MNIHTEAFVHELAFITGRVTVERGASIWPFVVLRADFNEIRIGEFCNVQDHTVIHCDLAYPVALGNKVTIGHSCVIHGCTIGEESLIGMHATVMNGAQVGKNCMVAAHTLVPENMVIPDNALAIGNPVQIKENRAKAMIIRRAWQVYYELGQTYKAGRQGELPDVVLNAMSKYSNE